MNIIDGEVDVRHCFVVLILVEMLFFLCINNLGADMRKYALGGADLTY